MNAKLEEKVLKLGIALRDIYEIDSTGGPMAKVLTDYNLTDDDIFWSIGYMRLHYYKDTSFSDVNYVNILKVMKASEQAALCLLGTPYDERKDLLDKAHDFRGRKFKLHAN